jgi:hypothetical protein
MIYAPALFLAIHTITSELSKSSAMLHEPAVKARYVTRTKGVRAVRLQWMLAGLECESGEDSSPAQIGLSRATRDEMGWPRPC